MTDTVKKCRRGHVKEGENVHYYAYNGYKYAECVACKREWRKNNRDKARIHASNGRKRRPLYATWQAMIARCENPNSKDYKNYGARGISVCERWHTYDNFVEDMGDKPSPKHSIDRVNNDGNYEPDNIRWATRSEQEANKRKKTNLVRPKGESDES